MAPKRRCPVCRSKQWHKEPSSGLIACSEGHVLQNYRNESNDMDDFGAHALRKRNLKSGKKKKEKMSQANAKLYHGARSKYLYFQCQQLVLRMQIDSLVALWSLPPEFKIVCRDLWSLHLSLLPNPPLPEPLFYAQELRENPLAEVATRIAELTNARADLLLPPEQKGETSSDGDSDSEDDVDPEDKAPDAVDPELEEMLRENSESSSNEEEDDPSTETKTPATTKPKKAPRAYKGPTLEGSTANVAILMLACWTMRIPVTYADFIDIIESYELPYLDTVRLLPSELSLHLSKHTTQTLSSLHPPTTIGLHVLTSRLGRLVHAKYGIFTPELNAAPILWRAVRALGGTPVLYGLAKKLAQMISLPLTLHYTLASKLQRFQRRDPERHNFDNAAPELSLVATIIVVLKMVYGLDGKERLPVDEYDPSALPSMLEYLALLKDMDENCVKTRTSAFTSALNISVEDFDDQTVDEYIQFCEEALLGTRQDYSRLLTSHFDLPASFNNSVPRPSRLPQPEPVIRTPALSSGTNTMDGTLEPGRAYPIYNSLDTLGVLPVELETVLSRASMWLRIPEDDIVRTVGTFERRFRKWWAKRQEEAPESISVQGDIESRQDTPSVVCETVT